MKIEERVSTFVQLGVRLKKLPEAILQDWMDAANAVNRWFTSESVQLALEGILKFLAEPALKAWVANYDLETTKPRRVGVIMAGNIPLAGFHDFLAVLLSGNRILIKKSSQDPVLLEKITALLMEINPAFKNLISFVERLTEADAIISTGSDNSARYFEYYFSKIPHIIRKNRTSIAVLNGQEPEEERSKLGLDIFTYFGLGCRNVSKIYIPQAFPLDVFFRSIEKYAAIINHGKYANNYDYNKAIYLLKGITIWDNGFVLLKEDAGIASPIAVIYFERYNSEEEVLAKIKSVQKKIQVIVSSNAWFPGSIPFGLAQIPEVTDYADNVDTLKFLSELKI